MIDESKLEFSKRSMGTLIAVYQGDDNILVSDGCDEVFIDVDDVLDFVETVTEAYAHIRRKQWQQTQK